MLLTLQLKLKIKKGHTPSIITVTITVYLKENGNKKMRKSHFNDEFLVLLGVIINRFFASSSEGKKCACSSPISM